MKTTIAFCLLFGLTIAAHAFPDYCIGNDCYSNGVKIVWNPTPTIDTNTITATTIFTGDVFHQGFASGPYTQDAQGNWWVHVPGVGDVQISHSPVTNLAGRVALANLAVSNQTAKLAAMYSSQAATNAVGWFTTTNSLAKMRSEMMKLTNAPVNLLPTTCDMLLGVCVGKANDLRNGNP